jgi:hypothetical protein
LQAFDYYGFAALPAKAQALRAVFPFVRQKGGSLQANSFGFWRIPGNIGSF